MSESTGKGRTTVERASEREFVVTRMFDAPAHLVFEAWSKAELFKLWWAPRSMGMKLVSCEMDVRTGGGYRLEFDFGEAKTMAFFGKYIDVEPGARMVWTNEEEKDAAITTVTFEDKDGGTLVVLRELYPSKAALEANHGSEEGLPEQFEQLDDLLITLAAGK